MRRIRAIDLVHLMMLVLCLPACSSYIASGTPAPTPTQPAENNAQENSKGLGEDGMAVFPGNATPVPSVPLRHISAGSIVIRGADAKYDAGGEGNRSEPVGDAYVLLPGGGADKLAYAVYALANLGAERPVRLDAHITPAPAVPDGSPDLPLQYYLGVADYTRYAWQWSGPYTADASIELNAYSSGQIDLRDRYVSADTAMYIAVATATSRKLVGLLNPNGLTAARVETLTLTTEQTSTAAYAETRPHFSAIESIGSVGAKGTSALDPAQYVTLTWTHVADSFGPANEAQQYQVFRRGPGDKDPLQIGAVSAPVVQYVDPANNAPDIAPPTPGATYSYFLRASNAAGRTPFSQHDYTLPLFGPADVAASDLTHSDMIELTWTRADGATGYKIYRDGLTEANMIATLGNAARYEDKEISNYLEHTYRLKSINQYQPAGGEWSNSDSGRRSSPPVIVITADPTSGTTPLAVNLDASGSYDPDDATTPGAGITNYQWDWEDDGVFDFDAGIDGNVSHTYTLGGKATVTVRVTDNDGVYNKAKVRLDINWRPVARLSVNPIYGKFPLVVDLDANASMDPDGWINNYEFDFGDGAGWVDYGKDNKVQRTFTDERAYHVRVRVVDSRGATGTSIPISISPPNDWWMFGHDRQHTHRSPFVGAQTNNVKWTFTTGGTIFSSPAIGIDGVVYFGSRDAKLYAVNPDGSLKWAYTTNNYVNSSPAVDEDQTIYVVNNDSSLYAIDRSGNLKWLYHTGDEIRRTAPVIGIDHTVYFGTASGNMYAVNPDGTVKWTRTIGGQIESGSPALDTSGCIYFGNDLRIDDWYTYCYSYLCALNPDGSWRWKDNLNASNYSSSVFSAPAIDSQGRICIGNDLENFWEFDSTHYYWERWGGLSIVNHDDAAGTEIYLSYPISSSPAIGIDDAIYVGAGNNYLYAINADSSARWAFATGGSVNSSPAIGGDGAVYVGSNDGSVYAINADGSLKWSYPTGGSVEASPAIAADGTVYVGSTDGKLYAFGP